MNKILIVNGHEYFPHAIGSLNNTLVDTMKDVLSDTFLIEESKIDNGYDIEKEQLKFKNADIIIFQTPIYWMSIPGSFKSYIDRVFGHGIFFERVDSYGTGGLLKGKKYMLSCTFNAPNEEFSNEKGFFEGYSIDELLMPIHMTMKFVGLSKINTFTCHNVKRDPKIDLYINDLKEHLKKYIL